MRVGVHVPCRHASHSGCLTTFPDHPGLIRWPLTVAAGETIFDPPELVGATMTRHAPTTREEIALKRIEAGLIRSPVAMLMATGLILSAQLLPDRYAAVTAIVSVGLMVGMLIYRACFLRCPRCAGWIVIPKCPSCGLTLGKPADRDRSAND